MTIEFLQNIAAINPIVRGCRIKTDGFVEIGQSLAQASEFVERRAANAEALRMFRGTPQDSSQDRIASSARPNWSKILALLVKAGKNPGRIFKVYAQAASASSS
jgi:hypothetical protein